jgi:outer membrane lipoprotein SlyB
MTRRDEAGQAIPLVIGVVAVMALLLVGVGWFGAGLVDAAAARTAADAAALAGAVDGRGAAAELAAANGSELVSFRQIGDDVIVTVRRGRATASARATANRAHLSTLVFRDADQPAG